jgi:hypothetical protein
MSTTRHKFENKDTDLILRLLRSSSTDPSIDAEQTDFRDSKPIISVSSPLFKQAVENPESISFFQQNLSHLHLQARLDDSGSPILVLPEDNQTIQHLLRTVYPNPSPTFNSLETVAKLIVKAKANQMNSAENYFRQLYMHMTTVLSSFQAYSIACVFGLEQEIQLAARLTLSLPMTPDSCIDDLQTATITDIRDLATYRSECYSAIDEKLSEYNEMTSLRDLWPEEGTPGGKSVCCKRDGIFPVWFCEYIASLSDRDLILIDLVKMQNLMSRHASGSEEYESSEDSEGSEGSEGHEDSDPGNRECHHCKHFPERNLQRARDILQSLADESVKSIVGI